MQRRFARRAHRSRVVRVFSQVGAKIYSRNYQVRRLRQQFVQRDDHRISRRAVHGPLPLRHVVAHNRLTQRQRLRRATLLVARRNNAYCRESLQLGRECAQALGLYPIIVR